MVGALHSPMGTTERGLRRAILRECRSLGAQWVPWPPACDQLWGRGATTNPLAVHPLLSRISPKSLKVGLCGPRGPRPLGAWLRDQFRHSPTSGSSDAKGVDDALDTREVLDFLRAQGTLLPCRSTSEHNGLRVDTVSGYVKSSSNPAKGQFVFTYNMRFTNVGDQSLRVLARQYDFRDASGSLSTQIKQDQLEAAGVVGWTPLLKPGVSFEFGSGVVLTTPRGILSGKFLVMEEPLFEEGSEDAQMHQSMETAELLLRLVYLKGLGTRQFYVPLKQLRFDEAVPCLSLVRGGL